MAASTKDTEQEPLSLEANFTLHVLSLFGTLFDNRAAPYIGVIPPDDIQPKVDEEEDGENYYEPPPPFETSLCDFRLRAQYKSELEARQTLIDDLSGRSEIINENSKKPEAQKFVLGDRLLPRNEKGTSTEAELKKKRSEFLETSKTKANERRLKLLTQKKNRNKEIAQSEREEAMQLKREFQKIKEAERRQREATAKQRKEQMEKRREIQMKKRESELMKTEKAQRTIENIPYRSKVAHEAVSQYDFRSREKTQKAELIRSVNMRKKASDKTIEHNKSTIKPKQQHNSNLLYL